MGICTFHTVAHTLLLGIMRNRLRLLRAERRWSQAELAGRLGVSRQTVNAIETGRFDPSLPVAFRIARVFGRSIEGIFEPDDDYSQGDGAR
jgi:putative transcriptional regulator